VRRAGLIKHVVDTAGSVRNTGCVMVPHRAATQRSGSGAKEPQVPLSPTLDQASSVHLIAHAK